MSGILSIGDSTPDVDVLQRSLELRAEHDWSVLRWQQYLRAKGADVSSRTINVTRPGPNAYDQYQSEFTFTYSYYSIVDYGVIDFAWDHANAQMDDFGQKPDDGARISFDDANYYRDYYYDDWVYYGEGAFDPSFESKHPGKGATCQFNDRDYPSDSYFGIRVDPQGGDAYTRDVMFRYVHTWWDTHLSGVTFSSGAPYVNLQFNKSTDQWDVERSYQEAALDDGETYSPN